MRSAMGLMLGAILLLAGCRVQPKTAEPSEAVAPGAETSAGVEVPVDDSSLSHLDSQGRQPADVLLEFIEAVNSRDLELAYSLYAYPDVDFGLFQKEAMQSQECYKDFAVHETRVISPGMALVRVTYHAATTPGEGERYPILIEEPGEWWRIEMVDGVWRVGWLARQ